MGLITSEQRDDLITKLVERDAFRLELKDSYAVASEEGPFATWRKGQPDDFAWFQPWLTRVQAATEIGKTVRRVRVITEPASDYIRWEHAITPMNLEAGEDIRWLPRHLLPADVAFPLDGNDWWLFDDRLVVVGHVDDDGRVKGHELVSDSDVAAECIRVRDRLWAVAVPHHEYELS